MSDLRTHVLDLLQARDGAIERGIAADVLAKLAEGSKRESETMFRLREMADILLAADAAPPASVLAEWLHRYQAAERLFHLLAGERQNGQPWTNSTAALALEVTAAAVSRQATALAAQGLLHVDRRGRVAQYQLTRHARDVLALVPPRPNNADDDRRKKVRPNAPSPAQATAHKIAGTPRTD